MSGASASTTSPPSLWTVLAIAGPVMLSNATTPLIGLVDAAVVGRLGAAALIGGVAMAAAIFNAIYWCFGFLRMGTTGFTAQAVGAGDAREVAATLGRAVLIAIAAGAVLVALQRPLLSAFLWFLGGSSGVQDAAKTYYDWRIWAAPAGLINFALLGWFLGLGRAMVAFWLQLAANLINIALALILTLWLGYGVAGVGIAAFAADTGTAVAGLALAWREMQRRDAVFSLADVMNRKKLTSTFAANRDILIRTACVLGAAQIFVAIGAQQGDTVLAANALLTHLLYITYYLLDGFAFAAEVLVGQAIGAKERARLDATVRLSAIAAGMTGIVMSAAIWFGGPAIIAAMTPNIEVQATAQSFLAWAALLPFVGVWCFLLDGIFIGATRTTDMRNMMLASFAVYLSALALLFPLLGNHGVWIAHMVFFIVRALSLAWKYPGVAALAGAVDEDRKPSVA